MLIACFQFNSPGPELSLLPGRNIRCFSEAALRLSEALRESFGAQVW